jgi:choline-glycine betaine transporter
LRLQEPHIAHRWFADIVIWAVLSQFTLGVYLRLHIERGIQGKVRPILVKIHKVLGAAIPIIGYVQIMLGVIASLGFCYDGLLKMGLYSLLDLNIYYY